MKTIYKLLQYGYEDLKNILSSYDIEKLEAFTSLRKQKNSDINDYLINELILYFDSLKLNVKPKQFKSLNDSSYYNDFIGNNFSCKYKNCVIRVSCGYCTIQNKYSEILTCFIIRNSKTWQDIKREIKNNVNYYIDSIKGNN